mmetsp:Transcript_40744/g.120818  ORF Transcript_40744/g.120818 Transcript_40744/m.120818 type:complete len:219 (+) Transcript_40744:334-990(+)
MTSTVDCCTCAARARSSMMAAPWRRPSSSVERSCARSVSRLQPLPGRTRSCAAARNCLSAMSTVSTSALPMKLLTKSCFRMCTCRMKSPCSAPSTACSSSGAALPALPQAFSTISCAFAPKPATTWPDSTCCCSGEIWARASFSWPTAPAPPSANAGPRDVPQASSVAAPSSASPADLVVLLRRWRSSAVGRAMALTAQIEAALPFPAQRGEGRKWQT